MYELFYRTEVNVMCLLILFWISYRSKLLSDKQTRSIMYWRVIVITIALFIVDTLLIYIDGSQIPVFYTLNWILNILYYILTSAIAFLWIDYILYYMLGSQNTNRTFYYVSSIPLMFYILVTLSSPFSQLLFYIDPHTNTFQKGDLFFIQSVITYGFFTFSSAVALASFFTKKLRPPYYHGYVTFFSFLLCPLMGGLLHAFFPGAKIVWQGLTLAFLLVYIEVQFDQVSRDSLTGLNNRHAFDAKINQIAQSEEYDEEVHNHIFMLDINYFKEINDKYGHPEGDIALIRTANYLKKLLGNTNSFLCRYGGDEFAIINYCSCEEAGKLRLDLYQEFEKLNKNNEYPYHISLSVGYAPIVGTGESAVEEAVKKADEELYKEKEFMHKGIEQLNQLLT